MTPRQLTEQTQSHLLKGDIENALNLLTSGLDSKRQRREHGHALLLKAKWEGLKQEQQKGIISRQDYELAFNKLIDGIQSILNAVEKPEEHIAGRNYTSGRSFSGIWIAAGLLCLVGISVWYLAGKSPGRAVEPIPQEPAKTEMSVGHDPGTQGEDVNSKAAINPANEGVQSSPKQKTTITDPVEATERTKTEPPKEIKHYSIIVMLNDEARLKIDDRAVSGSGTVKVALSAGEHKFEITEGNQRCVQRHEITETTTRLTLSCDN